MIMILRLGLFIFEANYNEGKTWSDQSEVTDWHLRHISEGPRGQRSAIFGQIWDSCCEFWRENLGPSFHYIPLYLHKRLTCCQIHISAEFYPFLLSLAASCSSHNAGTDAGWSTVRGFFVFLSQPISRLGLNPPKISIRRMFKHKVKKRQSNTLSLAVCVKVDLNLIPKIFQFYLEHGSELSCRFGIKAGRFCEV